MSTGTQGSVNGAASIDDVDAVLADMPIEASAQGATGSRGTSAVAKMANVLNMPGATYRPVWAGRVPGGKYRTTSGWPSGKNNPHGELYIFERTAPDGKVTFIRATHGECDAHGCETVKNAANRLKSTVKKSAIRDLPAKYLA